MPEGISAKYVKCPYYRYNDLNRIRCEGIAEECTLHLVFGDGKSLKRYKKTYCDNIIRCRDCRIHKMLDEKWRDDE